jgi:hypothetical protein
MLLGAKQCDVRAFSAMTARSTVRVRALSSSARLTDLTT